MRLPLAVWGLILVGLQVTNAATTCETIKNCKACAQASCKWCAEEFVVSTKNATGLDVTKVPLIGVCVPSAQTCGTVKINTLGAFLDGMVGWFEAAKKPDPKNPTAIPPLLKTLKDLGVVGDETIQTMINTTVSHSVVNVKGSDALCSTMDYPDGLNIGTCDKCLTQSAKFGYCNIGIKPIVSMAGLFPLKLSLCLEKSTLGRFCNPDVIPVIKSIGAFIGFGMTFVTEKTHCAAEKITEKPLSIDNANCTLNEKCTSCVKSTGGKYGSCTWCEGEFTLPPNDFVDKVAAMGKCIHGKNTDCSKQKIGTITDFINNFTMPAGSEVKFAAKQVKDDPYACKSVEWPPLGMEPNCSHCLYRRGNWAHYDGKVQAFAQMLPFSLPSAIANATIKAGVCVGDDWKWITTLQVGEEFKSTWHDKFDATFCPFQKVDPPSLPGTTTTTTISSTSGAYSRVAKGGFVILMLSSILATLGSC